MNEIVINNTNSSLKVGYSEDDVDNEKIDFISDKIDIDKERVITYSIFLAAYDIDGFGKNMLQEMVERKSIESVRKKFTKNQNNTNSVEVPEWILHIAYKNNKERIEKGESIVKISVNDLYDKLEKVFKH